MGKEAKDLGSKSHAKDTLMINVIKAYQKGSKENNGVLKVNALPNQIEKKKVFVLILIGFLVGNPGKPTGS